LRRGGPGPPRRRGAGGGRAVSDDRLRDFKRLSLAKQKLVLARLRKREREGTPAAPAAALPAIPLSPLRLEGGPYPLSFSQHRLWFIARLEPGSSPYTCADALRLKGRFAPALLARVLGEIVRRHEVLRTVFPVVDGRPVQEVVPPAPLPLPLADLAG